MSSAAFQRAKLLKKCARHIQPSRCVSVCSFNPAAVLEPNKTYDAVIVGAGHNGLVAAAYLAKSGASVCVLERRNIVGGAAVTEEIVPGFRFSRASYVLSLLRPQIIQDLELKKHGLKVYLRNPSSYTPLRRALWKDGGPRSLTLGSDESENIRQISQFSSRDAEAYVRYEKDLQRLVDAIDPLLDLSAEDTLSFFSAPSIWSKLVTLCRKPQLRKAASHLSSLGSDIALLYEYLTAPAARLLEARFESEPLKATLATDAVIGANITPHTPGSGYVLFHHVMGELEGIRGAWGYPEGGMGAVTQAMAKSAVSHSAHIFTEAGVANIVLDANGKASGVILGNGREILSKIVLSNATPKCTLDMLPISDALNSSLGSVDYTSPVTKINVALNKLPNFSADPNVQDGAPMPHHQATIHLNCEHMSLITDAYDDATRGRISRRPMIEMVLPSSLDPTLCAAGNHVCLLFTQYTPQFLQGGHSWDQLARKNYADAVFDSIEEYAPGFRSSIVGFEVLSPPDLEETFGLTGGNIFHGAMSPDRLFFCRPAPSAAVAPLTPVNGLLMCGAGAHPGGGVMGAPGRIAALKAIELLSK